MISNEWQPDNSPLSNSLTEIGIEGELRTKLQTIATWSKLTAIGGFINMGLSVLIIVIRPYSIIAGNSNLFSSFITLIVSFFVNYFLLKFSTNLKSSLDNENQELFVEASANLRSYMRLIGILMIAAICIMALAFIIIVLSRF